VDEQLSMVQAPCAILILASCGPTKFQVTQCWTRTCMQKNGS